MQFNDGAFHTCTNATLDGNTNIIAAYYLMLKTLIRCLCELYRMTNSIPRKGIDHAVHVTDMTADGVCAHEIIPQPYIRDL